jgi:hypothetical protein
MRPTLSYALVLLVGVADATPSPAATLAGYYKMLARHSGKAVVVQSASTADGANVIQWTYGGANTNDEWLFTDLGGGYYKVTARHSGKAMVVQSAATADGADVIQWTYGGSNTNDEWQVVDLGTGYYRLNARHSGKALEVSGAGTADGADVVQRTYSGGMHQQFQIVSLSAATPTSTPTSTPTPTPTAGATPSPTATSTPSTGCTRTIDVPANAALASAVSGARPGDCIVLANGNYAGLTISTVGTTAAPIVIRAANRLGAVFSSGSLTLANSAYTTLEGFSFTSSGSVRIDSSVHCRLTRWRMRVAETGNNTWITISGSSSDANRIDHCDIGGKSQTGYLVNVLGSGQTVARNTRIDHNYFHDVGPAVSNGMSTLVLGVSGMSKSSGFSVVEHNLFVDCDGEIEIISVKSDDNVIRYNTVRHSLGMITVRIGNRNAVYGNFMLQGGKAKTAGIRFYGRDQLIYDNYIENVAGSAIIIGAGELDDTPGPAAYHYTVFNAKVVHNTIVNAAVGFDVGDGYTTPPRDSFVANNIVQSTFGTLVSHDKVPVNMTYQGNIAYATGSATLGISASSAQFRMVNPLLARIGEILKLGSGSPAIDASAGSYPFVTDDLDGQARPGAKDVGCDEVSSATVVRRPLTTADVGTDAP